MGKTRRFICLLLTVVLCLSLLPAAALAEEELFLHREESPYGIRPADPGEDPDDPPAFDGATEIISRTGTYHQTSARSMLALINSFRTESEVWYWNSDNATKTVLNVSGGTYLQELAYDYDLEQIAMQRAAEITVLWGHTRPNGEICFTCTCNGRSSYGENIAMGSGPYGTMEGAFDMWREEQEDYAGQGHRRNMLGTNYTAVGVAAFEYDGAVWWVQEFGYAGNTAPTPANDSAAAVQIEVPAKEPVDPASLPAGSIEINETNFPDETFRWVIASYNDPNGDGWLTPQELQDTSMIECYGAEIASLQGLEFFTELEILNCRNNELTELDLSRCPKLAWLYCDGNRLTRLDISPCPLICGTVAEGRVDDAEEDVLAYFRYDEEDGWDYWGLTVDKGVELIVNGTAVPLPTATPAPTPMPTPAPGSPSRTALDAARALRWAVGRMETEPDADADQSGTVDVWDAAVILAALGGGHQTPSTPGPAPTPAPTPRPTPAPTPAPDLPAPTEAVTLDSVLALLDAYAPDGAWILRSSGCDEDTLQNWMSGTETIGDQNARDGIDTAVHEQCHDFTDAGWEEERIYTGNGTYITVPYTEVFDSIEMVPVIPESLRTSRFDTYVDTDEALMASRQDGVYGLLNEYTAYYWGSDAFVKLYDYYKDVSTGGTNGYVAYAEFRYYILTYMLYAREHYPDVYNGILENDAFRRAFAYIDDAFTALIDRWRASGIMPMYFDDEFDPLMDEMRKTEYVEMAARLRP